MVAVKNKKAMAIAPRSQNFQLFAELVNINDATYTAYQKGPGRERLLQYEEYGWTAKFGFKANF